MLKPFTGLLLALRPFSYTVSALPPILALLLTLQEGSPINWGHFLLLLLGCVAIHASANLISEYHDFQNGLDRTGHPGPPRALLLQLATPNFIRNWGIAFFLFSLLLALYFLVATFSWPLLILLVVGALSVYFYSVRPIALKHRALGDLAVFLGFGPFMALGGYLILAGSLSLKPILTAIPLGFLVINILHANNIRDRQQDKQCNITTLPMLIGLSNSIRLYQALLIGSYIATFALIAAHLFSFAALTILISLPLALQLLKKAQAITTMPSNADHLDEESAKFHLLFGLCTLIPQFIQLFWN